MSDFMSYYVMSYYYYELNIVSDFMSYYVAIFIIDITIVTIFIIIMGKGIMIGNDVTAKLYVRTSPHMSRGYRVFRYTVCV